MKHPRKFNFNDPDQARLFINGLRFEGEPIDFVTMNNGRQIELATLKDDEVGTVASMIWTDLMKEGADQRIRWSGECLN